MIIVLTLFLRVPTFVCSRVEEPCTQHKTTKQLAFMFNMLFVVYRVNISVADVVYLTLYNFL